MDLTIDAAGMRRMLGRMDVYGALLDAMKERRAPNESGNVLKLRVARAVQGKDLTVRIANAGDRVPAELAFIGRTLAEVHPRANLLFETPTSSAVQAYVQAP